MLPHIRIPNRSSFLAMSLLVPVAACACIAAAAPAEKRAGAEPNTPTAAVSGTVVDERSGAPVAEFSVTWGDDHSIPYWKQWDAKTFTGGRFTYDAPPFASGDYRLQVRAKGYKAAESRVLGRGERGAKLEFRLAPADRFAGRAVAPDGKAAAGAAVYVVPPGRDLTVYNGAPWEATHSSGKVPDPWHPAKADGEGRFAVGVDSEKCRVVVLHDAGFASVAAAPAGREAGAGEVRLRAWGTVECEVELSGKPAAGVSVFSEPRDEQDDAGGEAAVVEFEAAADTGPDGRCTLRRVPPGRVVVAVVQRQDERIRDRYWGSTGVRQTPVEVPAGGRASVRIGGGAEVTGRFTGDGRAVPWQFALVRLYPAAPKANRAAPATQAADTRPADSRPAEAQPADTRPAATRPADWRDEVVSRQAIPVEVRADGTFRATDVPPGVWRLDAMIFVEHKGALELRYAGSAPRQFRVPRVPGGGAPPAGADAVTTRPAAGPATGPSAIDLGGVAVRFVNLLDEGDPAPDFEAKTLDGKRLRLADLRGKYVLLDFWATWCGPCLRELPALKKSWDALKGDRDVVILGLSLDDADAPVGAFVAEHGYGWTQAVIGPGSKVASDYGVTGIPHTWLVLPDGTLALGQAEGLPELIAWHRQAAAKAPTSRPAGGKDSAGL